MGTVWKLQHSHPQSPPSLSLIPSYSPSVSSSLLLPSLLASHTTPQAYPLASLSLAVAAPSVQAITPATWGMRNIISISHKLSQKSTVRADSTAGSLPVGSDLKTLALADDSNVRRNHSAPNHGRSCHVILYYTIPRLSASTSTSSHLPLTSPRSLSSSSECDQHKCLRLHRTIAVCGLSDTDNEQVTILWLTPIKPPYPPLIPSLLWFYFIFSSQSQHIYVPPS